jgi:putative Ca2+/H+ antiporter (TMEM165/GDT1 family)
LIGLFLATYGAVFLAEIVGDKLLYTTGVLATRYRPMPIVIGATLAFMAKMAVAVAIGEAISHLPPLLVATLTTISFLGLAYTLWRKPVEPKEVKDSAGSSKAAMVSFAAIFFSEWGDIGQITAATMAARFSSPVIVWLGAVAAMVTKGILAASIGAGVRGWIQRHFSPRTIRVGGVSLLLVLGLLAVIETFEGRI